MTWEGTQLKDSGRRQGRALSRVSSPKRQAPAAIPLPAFLAPAAGGTRPGALLAGCWAVFSRPQSLSLVLLLPLLLPLGPNRCAVAQRCPQACVCDNPRRHVACRHQNLTEVPTAIPELTQRLDLQGNMLKEIPPAAFRDLPHLTHLDLRRCQVELVAEGALGPARELEKLHLDRNQLGEVPTEALEGLPALLELQLSGNPLGALRDGAFRPVGRSLQHLFLNSSGLEQIPPGAFSGLGPRLRSLHLQKNQLQTLPALPGLGELELVDLSGNPFHCDCQLLPLHRWLAGLNLRVGATCATPPSARGQRVKAAAAVFEACPGQAARKAKRTPAPRPGARGTPTKRRRQRANKVGQGVVGSGFKALMVVGV
ncbi:PREDICTED: chondroadherin-like protein [Bison bison bison]|uniref:Chondroadherin-like protein n=1 Tax=Bison bison bison TaxID=43346 RepID=A0A6P3GPZ0_BISBB|nr:PREDICTED: chondroadherin-like protein [Bison bison bison]